MRSPLIAIVCCVSLSGAACGVAKPEPGQDAGTLDAGNSDAGMADAGIPDSGSGALDDGGCTPTQLDALEAQIGSVLDTAAANPDLSSVDNYTLMLERKDGRKLIHSFGGSTPDTEYESASTSKWVAAAVILDVVEQGSLTLDSTAHELMPTFWDETTVTLRHLLSFRSGFNDERGSCINSPLSNFADCVNDIYTTNLPMATPAGSEFYYSSNHLQIAGLMAMNASGKSSWTEVFDAFKTKTGLFPTSRFDLPSSSNPRLAGGMHWTAKEYLDFLRALVKGTLLTSNTRAQMFANQRGAATVANSPIIVRFNEDWAYGFGNWLECPTALGADTYNCGEGHRNSSPGAYGAYPFIDFDNEYFGIYARQGRVATFHEGVKTYRAIEPLVKRWAHNQCMP